MARISLDAFEKIMQETIATLPESFDHNLIGGYHVEKDEKFEEDYYIMGEYIEEPYLGSFIVLYYGSFVAVLNDASYDEWVKEIRNTIWHELQHHLESLAGREELARQEEQEYLHNKQKKSLPGPTEVNHKTNILIALVVFILLLIIFLL
ncbi:hypothetical protein [Natronospira sp.]|uniref:hypothetical protein n=1 Tax=Natronospira sp. TaxID=2024970 RepID=UPI003872F18F